MIIIIIIIRPIYYLLLLLLLGLFIIIILFRPYLYDKRGVFVLHSLYLSITDTIALYCILYRLIKVIWHLERIVLA